MANFPISNVSRRVVFAASGTGPYAFTFEILAAGDIAVYKDDQLLTITTDYTVSINSNGTGSITLTAAPTGATQIAIVGNKTISRTTDFTTGGDFFANTLNQELDALTIFSQQNAEGLSRALVAPQTDPTTINMTLPRASVRAGKALGFDANGNPAIADTIGTNRGNWSASVLYYVRDVVKDTSNNNIWQCITQHTSSGSQPINTNADAAKWTLLVDAASATTSATNAANSATAAASSASAASTSATNAASSASSASSSASSASTSATNAASSASAASTSASNASTSATSAASSASAASTSATAAASSATAASGSASTASTQATNAASSASAAATSATNASNSASAASTSASNAATSATNASNSASAAANSATDAATAATAAAASFDSFDDRYLGAKTANPSVDNDGNALITGALYFNSSAGEMRVYTGSAWVAATVSPDTVSEVEFLATAGQTTYAYTSGYRVGYTYIWVNGVMLSDADFTATDGTNITFGTALALNDEVRIITFKAVGSVAIGDISGLQAALDAKLATSAIGVSVQAYDADLTTWGGKTAPTGTVVGTTDTQTLSAKTIEDGTFTNGYTEETVTANTSTAYTIALSNGTVQILTLTGNCTFTFPTAAAGRSFTLLLKQDGTGGRTVTWPAAVKWPGGTAPTVTSTASKLDKYIFTSDGTNWYGSNAGQNYTV